MKTPSRLAPRSLGLAVAFAAIVATSAGCGRNDEAEGEQDAGAAPTPSAPSRSPRSIAAATDAGPVCGSKPLPDCPLQGWMKETMTPAVMTRDFDVLELGLRRLSLEPLSADYPLWSSIARDGADAAHAQDLDAVKAACRGCHEQYTTPYRAAWRSRPVTLGGNRP